jgi:Flp pilus assembly protein TadD
MGKREEAHQALVEAVRLRPDWNYALYNLGLSFIERGDREAAQKQVAALRAVDDKLAARLQESMWRKYIVNVSQVK